MRQKYWAAMGVAPDRVADLRTAYESGGYDAVRRQWIAWLEGFVRDRGFVTSTELAMLYGALGEHDRAFHWLNQAADDQTRDLIYLRVYPELQPLRPDPRFAAVVERVLP
jgi:hypothetical protein